MAEIGLIAPEHLRHRVAGTPEEQWFNNSGVSTVDEWTRLLTCLGRDIGEFDTIVDWGCGCGRALRHLAPKLSARQHLIGMDVDAEAIAWVRDNYRDVTSFALAETPPTSLSAESVDLIVSHSILTHMPEDVANNWLTELARILKPGGLFITTFNGDSVVKEYQNSMPPEFTEIMDSYGFYYANSKSEVEAAAFPEYYGGTCHSITYIAKRWAEWFTIRGWIPRFALNYQDSIILEKVSSESHEQTIAAELSCGFDEEWYLQQNADVALDVKNGQWTSGLAHFLAHGLAEGRQPLPPDGSTRTQVTPIMSKTTELG
jgi:SAM-dependent methyltransferase